METIQIVLDKKLLLATDRAARKTSRNRSALVRDALREHLKKLELKALEDKNRAGYLAMPQSPEESSLWEAASVWPEK